MIPQPFQTLDPHCASLDFTVRKSEEEKKTEAKVKNKKQYQKRRNGKGIPNVQRGKR
jgi:hypothetical protein